MTQVVPDALLEMSRSVMWNRFAQVIPKRVYTLSFGCSFPANFESVNVLRNKLVEAAKMVVLCVQHRPQSSLL